MKKIFLHNWSGNGNLGDDEMDRLLRGALESEFLLVEDGQPWDVKIVGGGTLIAPQSAFLHRLAEEPNDTILFGVGVAPSWNGEYRDDLLNCRAIFVRDHYSQRALAKFEIPSILSADVWFLHTPLSLRTRSGTAANLMFAPHAPNEEANNFVANAKRWLERPVSSVDFFAMSKDEDMRTMSKAKIFDDGKALIGFLSLKETVFATRLHAHVAAWIAGVRDIRSILYDPKIQFFFERAYLENPWDLHILIHQHIEKLKQLCR